MYPYHTSDDFLETSKPYAPSTNEILKDKISWLETQIKELEIINSFFKDENINLKLNDSTFNQVNPLSTSTMKIFEV